MSSRYHLKGGWKKRCFVFQHLCSWCNQGDIKKTHLQILFERCGKKIQIIPFCYSTTSTSQWNMSTCSFLRIFKETTVLQGAKFSSEPWSCWKNSTLQVVMNWLSLTVPAGLRQVQCSNTGAVPPFPFDMFSFAAIALSRQVLLRPDVWPSKKNWCLGFGLKGRWQIQISSTSQTLNISLHLAILYGKCTVGKYTIHWSYGHLGIWKFCHDPTNRTWDFYHKSDSPNTWIFGTLIWVSTQK